MIDLVATIIIHTKKHCPEDTEWDQALLQRALDEAFAGYGDIEIDVELWEY
jgi:hypothetical protein